MGEVALDKMKAATGDTGRYEEREEPDYIEGNLFLKKKKKPQEKRLLIYCQRLLFDCYLPVNNTDVCSDKVFSVSKRKLEIWAAFLMHLQYLTSNPFITFFLLISFLDLF